MKRSLSLAAGVGAAVVAGAIVAHFARDFSLDWALVTGGAVLVALPFVVGASGRFDIFEPVYLFAFSFAVLFVVRPTFDLLIPGGQPDFVGISPQPTYSGALLLGLVGCASFFAGYYFPVAARPGVRRPALSDAWDLRRLSIFIAITAAASTILFGIFVVSNGGPILLSSLLAGRGPILADALHNSSGYLYTAPLWVTSLAVLLIAIAPTRASRLTVAGLILLVLSQLAELGLGDRSYFIPALASVILIRYLKQDRRPAIWTVTLALLFIWVIGINLPRDYRVQSSQGDGVPLQAALLNPVEGMQEFFAGADTAMIQGLAIELQYVPSQLDYQWGATYLEALSRPVPRGLWSDKPVAADTRLMEAIWPSYALIKVGFSFSLFAEPYLNFGWVGVVMFGMLFGFAWRSLYAWYRANASNTAVLAIYAMSLPFLFVYIRGGVGVDYQRQVIYVLPIVVASLLATVRAKKALHFSESPKSLFIDSDRKTPRSSGRDPLA